MIKKYYHRKLVRDKIPEVVKANKGRAEFSELNSKQFEKELKKKLIEEAKEVSGSSKKDVIKELADVLEILKSLSSHYKLKFNDIERYRKKKSKEKGSFEKKLFLIWSDQKSDS